jgi:hypothetical protein
MVHIHDRDLLFRQKNDLYIAEWMVERELYAMVAENELLYSKEQVHRAKAAHEFICNCGYLLP